jgi:hypothetical protein
VIVQDSLARGSVILASIVAAAALDPSTTLTLLDGKQVELATWVPIAERLVGPELEEATVVLEDLQRQMDGGNQMRAGDGNRTRALSLGIEAGGVRSPSVLRVHRVGRGLFLVRATSGLTSDGRRCPSVHVPDSLPGRQVPSLNGTRGGAAAPQGSFPP